MLGQFIARAAADNILSKSFIDGYKGRVDCEYARYGVFHTLCVILCCSASVTWVCVFHQSCSGSCGCAAENESMDRPSHRQPLGFRRRPETCQSTHQRGKDTHTHRLRYITSEDWEISRHIKRQHKLTLTDCITVVVVAG